VVAMLRVLGGFAGLNDRICGFLARHTVLSLLAFGLLLLAPGCQQIPATDRDESRYAQASRQIVETGEWGDIRFQDDLRLKKPPGIYWLQAGLREALGLPDRIASYRLTSLLGALGAVLLLFALARRCLDDASAWLAPAALAASFLLGAEARLATTDAVLLCSTLAVGMVLTLRLTDRPLPSDDLLLAFALAAGVLVKGPVILVLLGGVVVTALLTRRARPLAGLLSWRAVALFVSLALPWFWLIVARHGAAFWEQSLVRDVVGKAVSVQESHGQPPGFYLLTLPIAGWPWAASLPAIIWLAWRERGQPLVLALIGWVVPFWVVFELAPTKLVHYVLPTYPALILLAVMAWQRRSEWPAAVRYACLALFLLGVAMLAGAGVWLADHFGVREPSGVAFAAALVGGALLFLYRGRSLPWLFAGISLAYVQFWGSLVPGSQALWVSHRVAALTAEARSGCDAPAVAEGFTEPSLVFELGTATRLGPPEPLPDGTHCRLRLSLQPLAGDGLREIGTVSGLNYSRGREVEVHAYIESRR